MPCCRAVPAVVDGDLLGQQLFLSEDPHCRMLKMSQDAQGRCLSLDISDVNHGRLLGYCTFYDVNRVIAAQRSCGPENISEERWLKEKLAPTCWRAEIAQRSRSKKRRL